MNNIKVIELQVRNIRELTKKERIAGLNVKTWYMISVVPLASQAYIGFVNALIFFVFLAITMFILEFFDEDITDIFFSNLVIKTPSKLFWS